ncbi:NAD(P)/FAD-dependent oxidoreductase [Mycobacterium sp. CBMA293]|uniref:NAD(P)/FAD-dependent oxidoreductase n=2 Tax=Mycolicibacterium TaxID=1866885 RepID=UPI001321EB3B|nr:MULTISPECIES: FAD/NAD(P)-binding oxidoreductase [unclassified Mycolicibacterium]MUL49368.1 NAD(P)/FAD-dependent oxidoreductase [Mycolicibacterium sp. CBMA 360]MUL96774.1 NAD(P)/FAD-dependent oxidoreductase [Mycolicibacterium sp. CBMA 230]MUL57727.1 NAD(P)/FAD-dependent oxidoreductase [Mycolicibacterium sp. CBMA 335]MUL72824.1 NAD(P)/FAD-dependent oxidoreductase [Mycolicibacterium sp. CBMA 311]MUM07159.1 dehydrogenase [Mycolicibacterium sp. CBMA 213]
MKDKKLVILGAGIGGLSVVKELAESGVALDDLDITIVDEDFSHFLGFTLPWVLRGWRQQGSVPIEPTVSALSGVNTVTGTVAGIDHAARTVTLVDGTEIAFDALIIATGARNVIDKIPGLQNAVDAGIAVHYYSAEAAAAAHDALNRFAGGKLVFLVTSLPYRCPVAPYEGALLAADLLRDNGYRESTEITVYTPEKQPMPSAGPYAGVELVEMLGTNNIAFHGEHAVERIDTAQKMLHFADGAVAEFDLLVFVPPHEPAVTIDGKGWLAVDTEMATGYPGIYAIGDTAAVTAESGRTVPKAAIFAKNGAKTAARNALHFLGIVDDGAALSGEGYCYIDVGGHVSAQGKGNFFATPHPVIHLSEPSELLHHDKQTEEVHWRALWERATVPAAH